MFWVKFFFIVDIASLCNMVVHVHRDVFCPLFTRFAAKFSILDIVSPPLLLSHLIQYPRHHGISS